VAWLPGGLAGPGGWAFPRTIATWAAAGLGVTFAAWFWGFTVPFLGGAAVGALAGLLSPQRPGRATLTLRGRRQAVLQALGALLASLPVIAVFLAPLSQMQSSTFQG